MDNTDISKKNNNKGLLCLNALPLTQRPGSQSLIGNFGPLLYMYIYTQHSAFGLRCIDWVGTRGNHSSEQHVISEKCQAHILLI